MNISVPVSNTMEFIEQTAISPLISKCSIKVCYVSDDPNRNKSVITKDVATEMGRQLPGSPIVGYYNEETQDFEQHNRAIEIKDGKFKILDTTKPYGFVPTDAKVWFQKFNDEGVEREYLCTEGYLWTTSYPEAKRVLEQGNNQSMELNKESINGTWANSINANDRFFIINEALIEKLCILGEKYEPCFEGAQVKTAFSLDSADFEEFKARMFSMMSELKEAISKGGSKVEFTTYAVEIGEGLWDKLYRTLEEKYPRGGEYCGSVYGIRGIFEEGTQKFAILTKRDENKMFRMNFTYTEQEFALDDNMVEVQETYVPVESLQFSLEDNDNYAKKNDNDEGKTDKEDNSKTDDNTEGNKKEDPEDGGKKEDNDDDKKKNYSLEDVTEYQELKGQFDELSAKFSALEAEHNTLVAEKTALDEEITSLREFKLSTEKVQKQAMIDKFYMLSDEDKQDVVSNIDTYSLDDIEAKLSVICVRNKLNLAEDQNDESGNNGAPSMFSLQGAADSDNAPAWIKRVRENNK